MTFAVYVHWPFCVSKCPYCDFNSHVGDTQNQEKWRIAYRREIAHYAQRLPGRTVTSIFFGGGTPSLMEPATVEAVLSSIAQHWLIDPTVEITLEANPSSVEAQKFVDFRAAGVNRLSLGVQALNDEALKFLGRAHGVSEARHAIDLAARTFTRFSFDLIYARQGQTPQDWQSELRDALTMAGGHLSLYQLTIEPHTQFHTRTRRGEVLTAPDPAAVAMYEMTQDILNTAGLPAYEISNHASQGDESRHNLTYWQYDDYIGIGPGAHGRYMDDIGRHATENHRAPELWLSAVDQLGHGVKNTEIIDHHTAMREAVMMGLRLTRGINLHDWQKKFTTPLIDFLTRDKCAKLAREGYLDTGPAHFRATSAGLQRLNALLDYLLN